MQQLKGDAEITATTQQTKPIVNMAGNSILGKPWVIDSGATDHITCNETLLRDVSISRQQPVHIPNGASIPVKGSGKVTLPNGMKINSVLHIPDFQCNLISVSKLTKDYNCAITFVANLCVMQDLHSRTLIGMGRNRDGLYLLEPVQDERVAMKIDKSNNSPLQKRLFSDRK